LAEPPDDFDARCKAIEIASNRGEDVGLALTALGLYRLNESKLRRISRLLKASPPSSVRTISLHVLSNATTDYLVSSITGSGLRYGLRIDVGCAPFGISFQAVSDPDDPVHDAGFVLLALDHRFYFPDFIGSSNALERAVEELDSLLVALRGKGQTIILQTVAPPVDRLYGSLDVVRSETVTMLSTELNIHIRELADAPDIALLDVAGLAAAVGLEQWYDLRAWALAKLPFNPIFLPRYGDAIGRLLGAIQGCSRKLLVLDLDNTLWGGVVGDEGIEGLRLGSGDAEGEYYAQVQHVAKALNQRGILLAVCTKNDEAIALEAIRSHPGMILKEEDFVMIVANWSDKPSNVQDICETLNLGLDAVVFVDDNPSERWLMRKELPAVAVIELPNEPAELARALTSNGFFEAVSVSEEDSRRAVMYGAETKRQKARTQMRSLDEFLQSLDMQITFSTNIDVRFAQLINKTNQFNLTLRRYTLVELQEISETPGQVMIGASLIDRFGDHGCILALTGHYEDDVLLIDCWTMSCRVISRGVEAALLNHLVVIAKKVGVTVLQGYYVAGPRNSLVADHYQQLGFFEIANGRWQLSLEEYQPRANFILLNDK